MRWLARAVGSFFRLAPRGRRYVSECWWCDHRAVSLSQGVAEFRLCVHIPRAHPSTPESPEDLPDEQQAAVENAIDATLMEVGRC